MPSVIDSAISNRDYVVIIDRTGSMSTRDCPGGKSRYDYCRESVGALVRKVEAIDPDGLDCYFFNGKFQKYTSVTSDKIIEVFDANQPMGSTILAPCLQDALNGHFSKGARPTTILIITDGEANDPHDVAKTLILAANKIEADSELAISFIQIGKDINARDFLRKLDDDLTGAGAKFDIVDVKTMDDFDNKPLEEILFDAIMD